MATTTIYIIRSRRTRLGRHVVKMGRTGSLQRRLEQLQSATDHHLEVVHAQPAPAWVEAMLHQEFAARRIRGEWFSLDEAELAWAIELMSGEVQPRRRGAQVARDRARRMARTRRATLERKRAAGLLPADGRARCTPAKVRTMTPEELDRMNHGR